MATTSSPEPRDPEAGFSISDPGKAWRRGRGIPVVPAFDGYRAIAILAIVFGHVLLVSGVLFRLGDSAGGIVVSGLLPRLPLMMLFTVSGFVVYLPTVARDGHFGRAGAYAMRRGARILPAYWVALVIAIILLAAVPSSPGIPGAGIIATHVAVLQTPALLFQTDYPLGLDVIPPVWTLSVELVFYCLLPFVASWWFRRPFVGLLLAVALAVGWRYGMTNADSIASAFGGDMSQSATARFGEFYASQFPSWAVSLAAGMTGAWCYVRLKSRSDHALLARRALVAVAASALAVAVFVYFAGDESVSGPFPLRAEFARQSVIVSIGYPLAVASLLVAIALAPARVQRPFTNRPIRWTADISYGVYLIHFAIIWFALRELSLTHSGSLWAVVVWCAVAYPLSLVYGYLSARFLERPIRRWAHRFGRRAQDPDQAPAAAG